MTRQEPARIGSSLNVSRSKWRRTLQRRHLEAAQRRLPPVVHVRLPYFDENFNTRWDDIECSLIHARGASGRHVIGVDRTRPPHEEPMISQIKVVEEDASFKSEYNNTNQKGKYVVDESVGAVLDDESGRSLMPAELRLEFNFTDESIQDQQDPLLSLPDGKIILEQPSEEDAALLLALSCTTSSHTNISTISPSKWKGRVKTCGEVHGNEYEADDEETALVQPARNRICVIA